VLEDDIGDLLRKKFCRHHLGAEVGSFRRDGVP